MYECETLACELELFFVKTRSETQVIYHSSRITHEESRHGARGGNWVTW
jgi:hypothetical protein